MRPSWPRCARTQWRNSPARSRLPKQPQAPDGATASCSDSRANKYLMQQPVGCHSDNSLPNRQYLTTRCRRPAGSRQASEIAAQARAPGADRPSSAQLGRSPRLSLWRAKAETGKGAPSAAACLSPAQYLKLSAPVSTSKPVGLQLQPCAPMSQCLPGFQGCRASRQAADLAC